jgi:ABC-type Mn2+/Zn2+ transport system permease subunit
VAIVLALIAVRMSVRFQRLALVAAVAGMVGWVLGMSFAVTTDNPLF